jgi:2-methylisocitrate lyase-like PEP mutase family enzyme
MSSQQNRAQQLHRLHIPGRPLVLCNAWDVGSACLIEQAGAPVVATTSAGVSWSMGVADGAALGRDRAVDMIARIVAAVNVPVTADIENGYAHDVDGVGETIAAVLASGAVGVNLEDVWYTGSAGGSDTLYPIEEQQQRIAAARRAADAAGVALFINARTDTFLRGSGGADQRLADTIARAEAYIAAGASGIFVPGVLDPTIVASLTSTISAPVNVMVGPGAPSVTEIAALGVSRVSLGAAVAQAAYAVARRASYELLSKGTYSSLAESVPYGEFNALIA